MITTTNNTYHAVTVTVGKGIAWIVKGMGRCHVVVCSSHPHTQPRHYTRAAHIVRMEHILIVTNTTISLIIAITTRNITSLIIDAVHVVGCAFEHD